MKLPVTLRLEAEEELEAAFEWYNNQREGLGRKFLTAVQAVFDAIAANPYMHATVLADIRKAVVHRFPFCIFYRPHLDRIEVLAIFHTSRDPGIWKSRIEGEGGAE